MKKIPTIFLRDENEPRYVTNTWHPDALWVRDGEGTPTRKYDGTCVMFDGENWWARRSVRWKVEWPEAFLFLQSDPAAGKDIGWEPIQNSGFFKAFRDAIEGVHSTWPLPAGTYELCGPKINGNPEHLEHHELFLHAAAQPITLPPQRDFKTLRRVCTDLLQINHVEGIVFHHPDGRRAKIKGRDFRMDKS
jgi:hypothetical protein